MDKMPKNAEKKLNYFCNICDFICYKQSNYEKHLLTSKHKNRTNVNTIHAAPTEQLFVCECGKKYNYISGLSRHKLTCNYKEEISDINFFSLFKTPSTLVIKSNLLDFKDLAIAPAAVSPLIL